MKTAEGPSDIPEGHHYVIIIFSSTSIHIPGDERSRTNPGHGYPARTEKYNTIEYTWTHSRDEWVRQIEVLEREKTSSFHRHDPYVALEVASKAKIETKVVVGIK